MKCFCLFFSYTPPLSVSSFLTPEREGTDVLNDVVHNGIGLLQM